MMTLASPKMFKTVAVYVYPSHLRLILKSKLPRFSTLRVTIDYEEINYDGPKSA